jgi:hypothetical protein
VGRRRKEADPPRSPTGLGKFVSAVCEVVPAFGSGRSACPMVVPPCAFGSRPIAANGAGDTSRISRLSVWLEEQTFSDVFEVPIMTQCEPQRHRLSGKLTEWSVMTGFGRKQKGRFRAEIVESCPSAEKRRSCGEAALLLPDPVVLRHEQLVGPRPPSTSTCSAHTQSLPRRGRSNNRRRSATRPPGRACRWGASAIERDRGHRRLPRREGRSVRERLDFCHGRRLPDRRPLNRRRRSAARSYRASRPAMDQA